MEPGPLALGAQSLSHWTIRKVPSLTDVYPQLLLLPSVSRALVFPEGCTVRREKRCRPWKSLCVAPWSSENRSGSTRSGLPSPLSLPAFFMAPGALPPKSNNTASPRPKASSLWPLNFVSTGPVRLPDSNGPCTKATASLRYGSFL